MLGLYLKVQHSTWIFLVMQNNGSQHFSTPLSAHTSLAETQMFSEYMGQHTIVENPEGQGVLREGNNLPGQFGSLKISA